MHAFQTYERIQTDLTVKVVFRRNAFSSHADFTSLPHRPFAYHVFSNICTEVTEQMKTNKLWHEVIRTAGKSTRNQLKTGRGKYMYVITQIATGMLLKYRYF